MVARIENFDEFEPVITFAGGTKTLANTDAGKVFRCTAATTVQVGDALTVGFACGFIQDGAAATVTFTATGSMSVVVGPGFTGSPITTSGDNAEAYVRKTTSTKAVVTGLLS